MSVPNENSVLSYVGNGSTVNPYPITFRFLEAEDIKVAAVLVGLTTPEGILPPTPLSEGQDYTLTIFTNANNEIIGGEIKTVNPWDDSWEIKIYRDVPLTQSTVLPEFGPFPANALELALDKVTMGLQQLDRAVQRCFRISEFAPPLATSYPRLSSVLGVDGNGNMKSYYGADLLAMIQLPGALVNAPTAYWLTDGDKLFKKPDFKGQLGVQLDNFSLFISQGTNIGNWGPYIKDDATFSEDSHLFAPSQNSVSQYVAARSAETETAANAYTDTAIAGIVASPTGSVMPFALSTAPAGWVFASGASIGNATSNGTERANDDCHALFLALWTDWPSLPIYPSDSASPTTRGANAEADWVANKRLALPDLRGRTVAGRDAMGASAAADRLTNVGTGNPGIEGYTLGASGGEDRHQLTTPQMPSHTHSITSPGGLISYVGGGNAPNGTSTPLLRTDGVSINSAGGDQAHPNAQPTIVLNYIIKL